MKHIVLLSDGTGNSAAKQHRTNVWRLYQALDVHCKDQIAFYNDGVGSQNFLPLKILGGAFGWGLKSNVLELYKILCRNYERDRDNVDKIYLFGFSRGAFTVRMLAGMIADCGLYTDYADEDDLRKAAQGNFVTYREKYNRGWLTWPFRWLSRQRSCKKYGECPEIEFIGVWDTVEAYGFPINELVAIWDWLIFPLRFVDQIPSRNVNRACHVLSIDDERLSFHPVLWDENQTAQSNESQEQQCDVEQVWFAGVHSDVGGGYARNNLALVTLDWMIAKAEDASGNPGLHFIPEIREEYRRRSDWHGMQHDSRSGVRAYYRYKPRDIKRISKKAGITKPKIHSGVLERIQHNIVPYAPTTMPADYEVVDTRQRGKTKSDYESPAESEKRAIEMRLVHHVVTKRRWLYRAFVLATAIFALLLWRLICSADGDSVSWVGLTDFLFQTQTAFYALLDFADGWLQVLRQNPWSFWLIMVLATSLVLLRLKITWYRATQTRAMAAWAVLKRK